MDGYLKFPHEDEGQFPVRTNVFEPCEVYMEREHLIMMLEANLEAIHKNREKVDADDPALQAQTEEAIRQREELLAWAVGQKRDMLYVAIYPTSEEECKEPGMAAEE